MMHTQLHKDIQSATPAPGLSIHTYRMTTDGVVTVLLSFLAGDTFTPHNQPLLADMTASLLDAGTKRLSKNALRERIESLGAHVHFYARGNRVVGSIRCLNKDLATLIGLVAEQLKSSTFAQKEIDLVREQMLAQCEEDKSETAVRAQQRLSAVLYPKNHPNYLLSIEERQKAIKSITRRDIIEFHRAYYGRSDMHVVAVGDIEHDRTHGVLTKALLALPERSIVAPARPAVPKSKGRTEIVTVADKMSVDVYMGHEVPFTRDHDDYYPFMLGIEVLGGGGFTSHLMKTVRVRDGLTYHIHAGLSGFGEHDQGNWYIRSQFAPSLYTKGMATIHAELAAFMSNVLTDERIAAKKTELIGSYVLSLGTTRGMATRMLRLVDEGKPLAHVDEYIETIEAIDTDFVRRAIATHVHLDRISTIAAGSINAKAKPL